MVLVFTVVKILIDCGVIKSTISCVSDFWKKNSNWLRSYGYHCSDRCYDTLETLSKHWRRRGGCQPEVKFPALELISIITLSPASSNPTVAAARRAGLAASRGGHFIFRFVAPKIHGNSSIKSKNVF